MGLPVVLLAAPGPGIGTLVAGRRLPSWKPAHVHFEITEGTKDFLWTGHRVLCFRPMVTQGPLVSVSNPTTADTVAATSASGSAGASGSVWEMDSSRSHWAWHMGFQAPADCLPPGRQLKALGFLHSAPTQDLGLLKSWQSNFWWSTKAVVASNGKASRQQLRVHRSRYLSDQGGQW